jgi:FlaG/FlaF family flagellin (archaellin)
MSAVCCLLSAVCRLLLTITITITIAITITITITGTQHRQDAAVQAGDGQVCTEIGNNSVTKM